MTADDFSPCHFSPRHLWAILAVLALLAIVAYAPTLTQPLMEDDYPLIQQAQHYGDDMGWSKMFAEPIFRARATLFLLDYWINNLFDMRASAYYAAAILLHVIATWIVFAIGSWPAIGYRISAFAAAFFAICEGHQEAVMIYSGATESIQMVFGGIAFLCWLRILRGGRAWYIPAVIAYALALLTKESAVIFVALFALPVLFDESLRKRWVRSALLLAPFALMAVGTGASVIEARKYSFRFSDGSFSPHAPFWITWPESFARLFWIWPALAIVAILLWRPPQYRKLLAIGLTWSAISLIPYVFLTYMHQVPSRHTYLAGVGTAIIVGYAMLLFVERYWVPQRAIVIAVCGAILIHNVAYLWTKKRHQFLERAAPTEQLIAFARSTKSPIYVKCFPRNHLIAEAAVEMMVDGRSKRDLIWDEPEARARNAATFCYADPR